MENFCLAIFGLLIAIELFKVLMVERDCQAERLMQQRFGLDFLWAGTRGNLESTLSAPKVLGAKTPALKARVTPLGDRS